MHSRTLTPPGPGALTEYCVEVVDQRGVHAAFLFSEYWDAARLFDAVRALGGHVTLKERTLSLDDRAWLAAITARTGHIWSEIVTALKTAYPCALAPDAIAAAIHRPVEDVVFHAKDMPPLIEEVEVSIYRHIPRQRQTPP